MTQKWVEMGDIDIKVEKSPPIGWLVFDRPEKMNAMHAGMWGALPDKIRELEEDPAVRVIVFRGAGEQAFSAGADIAEFHEHGTSSTADALAGIREDAFRAIAECRKPTVGMIHGFCMGGGCAIALNLDIRIASEDAVFAITPARLGLGYPHSGIQRAVAELGPAATRYLFLTANKVNAHQAERMGLVQEVHPANELEGATETLALRIAGNAPKTIRAVRASVHHILSPGDGDTGAVETLIAECAGSEDFQEGLRAFVEKRPPEFRDA